MKKTLCALMAGVFLIAPAAGFAAEKEGIVKDTVELAKEHPGKTAGVAGCAAILIFPPAAIWCAATLLGGATYDGDTQKLVKEVTK